MRKSRTGKKFYGKRGIAIFLALLLAILPINAPVAQAMEADIELSSHAYMIKAGEDFASAPDIPLDQKVVFEEVGFLDEYFTFTVPSNGYVTLSGFGDYSKLILSSSSDLTQESDRIYDCEYGSISLTNPMDYSIGKLSVSKGTIYCCMRAGDDFSLTISFTPKDNFEVEPNDTKEQAIPIQLNHDYQGLIGGMYNYSTGDDYYSFTLPEDGYITPSFSSDGTGSQTAFDVYDGEKVVCSSWRLNWEDPYSNPATAGLQAGKIYYIRFYSMLGGPWEYSFNIHYTPADNWEREPNDTQETATPVEIGRTYKGFLHRGLYSFDEADYYVLTLTEAKSLCLDGIDPVGFYASRYSEGKGIFDLQPGTYYLRVILASGEYSFRIDEASAPAPELEPYDPGNDDPATTEPLPDDGQIEHISYLPGDRSAFSELIRTIEDMVNVSVFGKNIRDWTFADYSAYVNEMCPNMEPSHYENTFTDPFGQTGTSISDGYSYGDSNGNGSIMNDRFESGGESDISNSASYSKNYGSDYLSFSVNEGTNISGEKTTKYASHYLMFTKGISADLYPYVGKTLDDLMALTGDAELTQYMHTHATKRREGRCFNLAELESITFLPGTGNYLDPATGGTSQENKMICYSYNGITSVLHFDDQGTLYQVGYDVSIFNAPMYRLYNPNSGEHFYTSSEAEKNNLVAVGWGDEGTAWIAPSTSKNPVYRLYNPNTGDHHFTTGAGEKDSLVAIGWQYEGIGWYSSDEQTQPLYRLYNPNCRGAGSHHYTTNPGERNNLVAVGWKDEGIAWYGL